MTEPELLKREANSSIAEIMKLLITVRDTNTSGNLALLSESPVVGSSK